MAGVRLQILDDALQSQQPQAHDTMELFSARGEVSKGTIAARFQKSAAEKTQKHANREEGRGQERQANFHRNFEPQSNSDRLSIFSVLCTTYVISMHACTSSCLG